MTRPIDAESLKRHFVTDTPLIAYDFVRGINIMIDNEPTLDVVPVIHAKWIPKITKIGGIDWPSGMKCSGCGEDALNAEGTDFLTDFCPWCGARMDSE